MRLFLILLFLISPVVSASAGSSDWFRTEGAKIRLIALPSPQGTHINAGLQIELEKGWKTYWRSPGASGLPPQLDFAGSKNIASTALRFPVPTTFGDGKNLTAGYTTSVTLPITIEPLFPNRAVTINTTGILGICEEICVPVQFRLSLAEDGTGVSTADVARALFQSTSNLVSAQRDDLKIEAAKYAERKLLVRARVPMSATKAALMVEGPSDWYLTPAKARKVENGTALFEVNFSDIPQDADPTKIPLTFTLVSHGDGVEQKITPQ